MTLATSLRAKQRVRRSSKSEGGSNPSRGRTDRWIASSQALLAMTGNRSSLTIKFARRDKRKRHDRIFLRLFQPLDLSRLPQHPAARKRAWRRDFVAADPGRRHLQHRQSQRLCLARDAGAVESALHEKGPCRLG